MSIERRLAFVVHHLGLELESRMEARRKASWILLSLDFDPTDTTAAMGFVAALLAVAALVGLAAGVLVGLAVECVRADKLRLQCRESRA